MLMKILIGLVVLFPWGLLGAVVLGALYRRRASRKGLRPSEYIPPPSGEPILFDSAQVAKCLREGARQ